MKRIKSGDEVIVMAGKSKGQRGKVLRVDGERIYVIGVNLVTKHVKEQQGKKGEIIKKEAGIHCSNVALYNPSTNKPGKIGFKYLEEKGTSKKVRYFKSNNEIIDRI